MPEEMTSAINDALSPVPDHAIQMLVSAAVGVASGVGGMESLVARFVSSSGVEPAEAQARAQFVVDAHQAQADSYLTSRAGIAKEDLKAFYESVKSNPRQLQDAIRGQLNGSMAAWGKLASAYQSNTAPSESALSKSGYETRNVNGTPEVHLGHGIWSTLKAAAKAGFI